MDDTEFTDERIAAGLAAQPAERWRRLFDSVDALGDLSRHVSRTRSFAPAYSEAFHGVEAQLYDLGVVVPFGWAQWDGPQRYPNGAGLDTAPVADAARLCTTYLRGERFNTGVLAGALEDGTFDRIFARLRKWYSEQ